MHLTVRRTALLAVAALLLTGTPNASAAPPAASGLPLDLTAVIDADCLAPGNLYVEAECPDTLMSTYVQESVPPGGPLTLGGTTFAWPEAGLRVRQTVSNNGRAVAVPKGTKGYRSIAALMGFRGGGPMATSGFTVRYTDGSKSFLPFKACDWKQHPELSAIKDVRTQWLPGDPGSTALGDAGCIQMVVVPLDPKKQIREIQLPGPGGPTMMMFSMSLSMLTKAPKP